MDLEGTWNPPEEWPETSPPLPGWVRGDGGSWHEPSDPIESSTESEPASVQRYSTGSTVTRPTLTPATPRPSLTHNIGPLRYHQPSELAPSPKRTGGRRAANAAVLAAITACMIAGGVVLLLLLL